MRSLLHYIVKNTKFKSLNDYGHEMISETILEAIIIPATEATKRVDAGIILLN